MKQSGTTRVGAKLRALVEEVEADVSRLIVYMNDEVVPEVRRGSSRGLRMVAGQLGRLAEQFDSGASDAAPAGAPGGVPGRPTAQAGDRS